MSIVVDSIAWADPGSVAYVYRGTGKDRPRFMKHLVEGWEWPGVTTALNRWDKGGLINWAGDLERTATLNAAEIVYSEMLVNGPSTASEYRAKVQAVLGDARSHVKAKDKAADIGKAAHDHIQWQIQGLLGAKRGPEPHLVDESRLAVMAWEDHWKAAGITPLRSEQPVWHRTHRYAGTADLIAMRDGKLGVVDFKSSKSIYAPMHVQVAAYVKAIEHQYHVEVEWAELWRLPKTLEDIRFEVAQLGQIKVWDGAKSVPKAATRDELFRSFLGVLEAWRTTCCPPED